MRLSSLRAGLCWLLPSTPRQERGEGEGKKNHNGVGVRQKAGERYPLSGLLCERRRLFRGGAFV